MHITDDDIERALDYLRDNASHAAVAKGERVFAEEYRKSLKAILASQSNQTSEHARSDFAYSHPKYLEHLEVLKAAVIEDEKNRGLRVAAEARIEAWRTQSSNQRAMKI